MKRYLVASAVAVCFALLLPGTAEAGIITGGPEGARESWYTYWGLGWVFNSYSGEVEKIYDAAKAKGLNEVSSLDMDAGFLWPLPKRPRTLLGIVAHRAIDHYEKGDESVKIESHLLGCSSMHFFGSEPGAGFFIRGDLGIAWYKASGSDVSSMDSDRGYGALVGGGYGIRVTEGTRILFNANYSLRHVEGDNFSGFGMSIGGLF